jgi:hypothetical protein
VRRCAVANAWNKRVSLVVAELASGKPRSYRMPLPHRACLGTRQ